MSLALHEASAAFFAPLGGAVTETSVEPLEPEPDVDTAAFAATVTVEFDNAGMFGDASADIYDHVYPRYRALRQEWWAALRTTLSDDAPWLRPYLLPLPAPNARTGPARAGVSPVRPEVDVVPLDAVPRSSYVDRLRREFSLEYGLRGASGRLLDLAEGLLVAVRAAVDVLPNPESVVELGAGTGAATGLVLRRARPKRALVQDVGEAAGRHLREHLGALASQTGVALQVVTGDCRELTFDEPISLLIANIPFAQLPSLLARRGEQIRAALGDEGMLVAASSAMGMRFYQGLTDGSEPRLSGWPWRVPGRSLPDLFASGAAVRMRNLVVSVASASPSLVDATLAGMAARGGEVLT
jgi:Dimethyladenosine transferase (rRNA methylation)